MSAELALRLVEACVGGAIALSALEGLCLRRERDAGRAYHWNDDHAPRPAVLRVLYREPGYTLVCGARLLLALALALGLLSGPARGVALFALLAIGFLVHDRLRYGTTGADLMMGIVTGALALGALAPHDPAVRQGVLWFVALQAVLTYAATGVTKLRIPAWPDGRYLAAVFRSRTMGHPLGARLTADPRLARALSHAVIAFECAFPLALVTGGRGALAFCAAALVFHASIAWMMGLKMFILAFGATWPAIVWCAGEAERLFSALI